MSMMELNLWSNLMTLTGSRFKMKIGDLVRIKHDHTDVGIISGVDPNIHNSVTYKVWYTSPVGDKLTYNYQLEVLNESR